MTEVKHLQERHAREISELRQAKAAEIQRLSNRLMERTEASCALSSELKASKRRAEMRESKLRSQMTDEKAKVEKMAHQEKVKSRVNSNIMEKFNVVGLLICYYLLAVS
jgi:hypothetical protein